MATASGAQVVTSKYRTRAGRTFRAGARTEAHLDYTVARLAKAHPKARLVIIQPCYNTGVSASAGTHDQDGCLDFAILGLGWWEAQRFLRECGWACWYRHTGTWAHESAWHIHAISLGCPGPLGLYVDGGKSTHGGRTVASSQIDDYHRHSYGLAGQHTSGADHSWFPAHIDATVFDYAAWVRDHPPIPARRSPNMNDVEYGRQLVAEGVKHFMKAPKSRRVVRAGAAAINKILGWMPKK